MELKKGFVVLLAGNLVKLKKMFDETHTDAIPDISSQAQGWIVDELCVSLSAQATK